ncbi:PREDICTED: CMRF35-like molecule 5 [Gavialis gangeticus]|uniref:CMRF35-like molecule 5 n=1 Tax=Gavialis gangeticus TaxID=94835 RepID=UPI00092F11F5|nr:PREDICTED: CMRF35-like molecule 5 [Gavialis gangeticus]
MAIEGKSTTINCYYNSKRYLFSNKYWCRGASRSSCDVLGDTHKVVKSEYKGRLSLVDDRRGTVQVTMHQLAEDDSGTYWCGIEKPYADIMTAVELTVTEEPPTTPVLTVLGRPHDSCLGRPAIIRCHAATGSRVTYTWYQEHPPTAIAIAHTRDLVLQCKDLLESQSYYCQAATRRATKSSWVVRAKVLAPATENCSYQLHLQDGELPTCARATLTPLVEAATPSAAHSTFTLNSASHPALRSNSSRSPGTEV